MKRYPCGAKSSREFFNGWLRIGILNMNDGSESRFINLRLPSYGMMYSINSDEMRWGQRVLVYRGDNGFSIWPYFRPDPIIKTEASNG